MRRPRSAHLFMALLLGAGMLASGAPAKAALPGSSPTDTDRCANGKTARTWIKFGPHPIGLSHLAADNPCTTEWVLFYFHGASESDPYGLSVFVAPGQRINLKGAALAEWGLNNWWDEEYGSASLVAPNDACVTNYDHPTGGWTGYRGLLFKSATDVRNAPECGSPVPKYSAAHYTPAICPASDHQAGRESAVAWKTEGKKVVGLSIGNDCDDSWIAAWWKLDNGRTAALWMGPGTSADLWKTDFAKLPVKTKDGRVRVTTYFSDQAAAKAMTAADPKQRPFYYNGLIDWPAGGDTVRCSAGRKSC